MKISSFAHELRIAHRRLVSLVDLRSEFVLVRHFRWMILPATLFNMMDPGHGTVLVYAETFKGTQCYDPRDRVFSLLHLEWQDSRLRKQLSRAGILQPFRQIQVDYNSSLADIYVDVCMTRIASRYYPSYATHAANLLLCLKLDEWETQRVVDILLDGFGTPRREGHLFWALAIAVDLSGKLGSIPFDTRDRLGPVLASVTRMRDVLSNWREARIATGEWHATEITAGNAGALS